MLPDEVVLVSSVSSFKRHLDSFCVTEISIIITKPTCSTGSHRKSQCDDTLLF